MKKTSLLFGAATLMLAASCSNDEVVNVAENHGAAIGFSSFVDKSTRATDNSLKNLLDLKVWGVTVPTSTEGTFNVSSVFGGEIVSRDKIESSTWTYAPLRYWIPGNDYNFTAIAPANANVEVTQLLSGALASADVKGNVTITFDNNATKGSTDLLYDFQKVAMATSGQGVVEYTLKHMLSRVRFQFNNNFASENTVIRISNLKIKDAVAKATINKAEGAELWSDPAGTFDIDFEFTLDDNTGITKGAKANTVSDPQYIIPLALEESAEGSVYNVTFDVELGNMNGDEFVAASEAFTHTVKLPAIKYINNFSYTFIADIDEKNINPNEQLEPIKFGVENVEGWNNYTTYNVEPVEVTK